MTLQYDRTLPTGLPLAELADTGLDFIGEGEKLKGILNSATKDGALKEMLEIGYAATVIEFDFSGQTGNFAIGDVVTGSTSLATGTLVWQDDLGSAGSMIVKKTSGTFQEEVITVPNANAVTVVAGTLNLTPGGTDNKYSGEVQVGAEVGSGVDVYDELVAVADGLTALRANISNLFQGG